MLGGNFLHWSSEWCEDSKGTAVMSSQIGNQDWNANMLFGEHQYEGHVNQIGFPVGVCVQVSMTAHCLWNQLQTKADLSGHLASIQGPPDDIFRISWIDC